MPRPIMITCLLTSATLMLGCASNGAVVRPPPPAPKLAPVPVWMLDKTDYALKVCEQFFDTSTCYKRNATDSKPL